VILVQIKIDGKIEHDEWIKVCPSFDVKEWLSQLS
jgi:hypothetical protein